MATVGRLTQLPELGFATMEVDIAVMVRRYRRRVWLATKLLAVVGWLLRVDMRVSAIHGWDASGKGQADHGWNDGSAMMTPNYPDYLTECVCDRRGI